MGQYKLAIAIVIVSVIYIAAMVILFWRYRKASAQLAEKLRECQEKEEKEAQEKALALEQEDITVIYKRKGA